MTQSLIIQHRCPESLHLNQTARLFRLPQQHSERVLRLNADHLTDLPENVYRELAGQQADFALLPDIAFDDIKLIVSDMDSTLITIECIDEIAAAQGLKNQVAEITERAMQGELDFAQSLTQRVALLKGLPEQALAEVYEHRLRLTEGAEYLIEQCRAHAVTFVLVSGGFTYFTDRLKQQLGFQAAHANQLEIINGRLSGKVSGRIIDAQAKAQLLAHYCKQIGCRPDQTVAVGDGANDIPMLQSAAWGIAFHAKPKTQAAAKLSINHNGLEAVRGWFI